MSTATDDQSANLAPGLLALSHVWSTNDRPTMTTLVSKVFLEELPQGITIITLTDNLRIERISGNFSLNAPTCQLWTNHNDKCQPANILATRNLCNC